MQSRHEYRFGETYKLNSIFLSSEVSLIGDLIKIKQTANDHLSVISRQVSEWCIDTAERQTREALIKLGWTPPKTNPPAAGEGE